MSTNTITSEAPEAGGLAGTKIRLWSKYRELRMPLVHDEYEFHPNIGRHLVKKGITLHFRENFAEIDGAHIDLLMRHPAFAGEREPKCVWFADDQEAEILAQRMGHATNVVTGAIGSHRQTLEPPPTPGWNKVGPEEVRGLIEKGHVPDLIGAVRYETNHRNNELVVRYLAAAIAGQPVKANESIPDAEPAAPVDAFDGGFQREAAPSGVETSRIPEGQEVV